MYINAYIMTTASSISIANIIMGVYAYTPPCPVVARAMHYMLSNVLKYDADCDKKKSARKYNIPVTCLRRPVNESWGRYCYFDYLSAFKENGKNKYLFKYIQSGHMGLQIAAYSPKILPDRALIESYSYTEYIYCIKNINSLIRIASDFESKTNMLEHYESLQENDKPYVDPKSVIENSKVRIESLFEDLKNVEEHIIKKSRKEDNLAIFELGEIQDAISEARYFILSANHKVNYSMMLRNSISGALDLRKMPLPPGEETEISNERITDILNIDSLIKCNKNDVMQFSEINRGSTGGEMQILVGPDNMPIYGIRRYVYLKSSVASSYYYRIYLGKTDFYPAVDKINSELALQSTVWTGPNTAVTIDDIKLKDYYDQGVLEICYQGSDSKLEGIKHSLVGGISGYAIMNFEFDLV